MRKPDRHRARQRLDERLQALKPEDRFKVPPRGWIRAIREALAMTGVQFSARLKVRPQSVDALERSEANGTIQLNTLRRAAAALDCTVVYALVPNSSLQGTVRERSRKIASQELERVAHTMKLEAQGTAASGLETRTEDFIRDTLNERDLWNEQ